MMLPPPVAPPPPPLHIVAQHHRLGIHALAQIEPDVGGMSVRDVVFPPVHRVWLSRFPQRSEGAHVRRRRVLRVQRAAILLGAVGRIVCGVDVEGGGRGVVAAEEAAEGGFGAAVAAVVEGGRLRVDGGAVYDGADVVVEGGEAGGGLGGRGSIWCLVGLGRPLEEGGHGHCGGGFGAGSTLINARVRYDGKVVRRECKERLFRRVIGS